MDSENPFDDTDQPNPPGAYPAHDAPREAVRMLDRMVELGWVAGWGQNDIALKRFIRYTPVGRARLAALKETLDALDAHHAPALIALSLLSRGLMGDELQG